MTLLNYLPLVLALSLLAPVALSPVSRRANRVVTRFALAVFGRYVRKSGRRQARRKRLLRAAHVGETHRLYASKTWVYATLAAVTGSVLGVYLVGAVLAVLSVSPEEMRATLPAQFEFLATLHSVPTLSASELFVVLLFSSATVGIVGGALTYWLRWANLSHRADARERQIDESLGRTVAFMYALSRSGMAFPEILRTLAHNHGVYGEAAEEVGVAVKAMDLFGLDMLSAIQRMAHQSPSQKFEEFAENLTSVLRSGQSLPSFLHDQYERYQEDAKAQQEAFLELLATLAEGYVSLLVVGPLLLITLLVIVGLMDVADTLQFLTLLTYLLVPLGNVGFVVYLDSITESLTATRQERDVDQSLPDVRRTSDADARRTALGDGGTDAASLRDRWTANFERLALYDRFRDVRSVLANPIRTALADPVVVLYATVPLAVLGLLGAVGPEVAAGTATARTVDDAVVLAALFVLGTFAVVQELRRRRLVAIEATAPDLLDRLASVNEAGMTVVESLERVVDSDLGVLDEEVRRLWRDVEWGTDASTALYRFENRVDSPTITRVVTLVTNAMHASGDIGRVLRIAADDAQATRRLRRQRRQEMATYIVIIYLSFFVFLVIVGALDAILIPELETLPATEVPTEGSTGTATGATAGIAGVGDVGSVNIDAYTLVFFHTALVQGLFSGLVAGKMGEGTVRDGAKHATVLVSIAYVVFLALP
ncbi:type II secretion system F family protein [Halomicrococcus gelatinilyticus]|uniref:type II secretion system F family protein n=1 Tax=Halomicrococcus gelatinilyticus TaxID=1702103 RepID=UPI002E0E74A8